LAFVGSLHVLDRAGINPLDFILRYIILTLAMLTEGRRPETARGGAGCGARGQDLSPCTRAASGLRPAGHYEPPARSWLTIRGSVRTKARPDVGENAAAKRREARRRASFAGGPFRREDRP
jgi:hypothetical protein